MSRDETLGDNIRRLRDAAGLSQAELAERIGKLDVQGIYPQTIAKIEGGTRALKFAEGLALARVLGVRPEALDAPDAAEAEKRSRREAGRWGRAAESEHGAIKEAVWRFLSAQHEVLALAAHARAEGAPYAPFLDAEAAQVGPMTVEEAVNEGTLLFEHNGSAFTK